ncbi:MAG: MFS transporter [Actinomycetota bacterium]|nr:MFS transporter [Actinomycetota bacterium]
MRLSNATLRGVLRPPWVNRTLALVWAARVSMSAGRALAGVVAPLYLAALGFGGLELGELFVGVALASAVLSSAVGLLSDRLGRKPFLIVFPMLTAGAAVVFATVRSVPVLFVAAALGSFGRGSGAGAGAVGPYQPAESALVTEDTPAEWRNSAFGRLQFGSSFGALAGSLLAMLAGSHHVRSAAALPTFRSAFVAIAAVSLVAGALALWMTEPAHPASSKRNGRRPRLPVRSRGLLVRLAATNSVNGLAVGMMGPFLTYWFYRRFGAGAGEIGLLYAAVNAVSMSSALSASGLARRWGLVRTVAVVRVLTAVLVLPLVLAPTFVLAGVAYALRMVVQRAGMPLRQSYVVAMADPEERSSVAALSNLPSQVLMGVSPLASGYLLDDVSLSLPFELAGLLQLVNAALYWYFFRHLPPAEEVAQQAGELVGDPVDRP